MNHAPFATCFEQLTDHPPFGWQTRLYECLRTGDIPPLCDIPTGLGKTSVIALWLLALAEQASHPDVPLTLPRRLVYVVNRRVVVDQASDEADKLFSKLHDAEAGPLFEVAETLRSLSVLPATKSKKLDKFAKTDERHLPFALSTLRGQLAENRAWSADPCRPAIIIGTVDLIGSRLLFSGYRAGFKTRPLYAAFLGQDSLILHDEAHLEPAFQKLLDDLAQEQRAQRKDARPIQIMQLSATTRGGVPSGGFALTIEERSEKKISDRLQATKLLTIHPAVDVKQLPERLAELAFNHQASGKPVLVFARRLDTVEKTVESLCKKIGKGGADQVQTLTGTMRGLERDDLVKNLIFRRFLPKPEKGWDVPTQPGTVYLVCTSAGEVGVNLSAAHLACDLTTFENMAQRFGRVNRFGSFPDTQVDVVPSDGFDADDTTRLMATQALLERLHGSASPAALGKLGPTKEERKAAFSPEPDYLETSGILFDAWTLTSIRQPLPGRPPVEPYLHGCLESEAPMTQVAWREEVERLTDQDGGVLASLTTADLKEMLAEWPLKPQEILQDRSARVVEILARLVKWRPAALQMPVWLMDDDDNVTTHTLGDLLEKRNRERFDDRTLLLSPSMGGLSSKGTLDADADAPVKDVSDRWLNETGLPRRLRLWSEDPALPPEMSEDPKPAENYTGMRLIRKLNTRVTADDEDASEGGQTSVKQVWWWYERPAGADNDGSESGCEPVPLRSHVDQVEEYARGFVAKLPLPPGVPEAVCLAARYHDLGKRRFAWQRNIGNRDRTRWLAKPGRKKTRREERFTYRHEFGSLLDVLTPATANLENDPAWHRVLASAKTEFAALSDDSRDLALHLIATHHGRARPHFAADETYDPEGYTLADFDALAAETPRRFARLQRQYGRWGLAFLESLLRAADYAASANPQP